MMKASASSALDQALAPSRERSSSSCVSSSRASRGGGLLQVPRAESRSSRATAGVDSIRELEMKVADDWKRAVSARSCVAEMVTRPVAANRDDESWSSCHTSITGSVAGHAAGHAGDPYLAASNGVLINELEKRLEEKSKTHTANNGSGSERRGRQKPQTPPGPQAPPGPVHLGDAARSQSRRATPPSVNQLEQKVIDDWRRQRSCDSTHSTVLIGQLEKQLKTERKQGQKPQAPAGPGPVLCAILSQESYLSGQNVKQLEKLEQKVVEDWKRQRSCDSTVLIDQLEKQLKAERKHGGATPMAQESHAPSASWDSYFGAPAQGKHGGATPRAQDFGSAPAASAKASTSFFGAPAQECAEERRTTEPGGERSGSLMACAAAAARRHDAAVQPPPAVRAPSAPSAGRVGWKKNLSKDREPAFSSIVAPGEGARRTPAEARSKSLPPQGGRGRYMARLRTMLAFCARGFRRSGSRTAPEE